MITPEVIFTLQYLHALHRYVMLFSYLLLFNSVMKMRSISQSIYQYCLWYCAYFFIIKLYIITSITKYFKTWKYSCINLMSYCVVNFYIQTLPQLRYCCSGYCPKVLVKNSHNFVIFRKHFRPLIRSGIHNTNPANRDFTLWCKLTSFQI